ncbi:hypothetical protein JCM33374_g295 [Metschnikowia sp. JCM 33374]|nr:hypothetical protein JCM33374_g295 [Metschnikowia sp. JCM 33374]
MISLESDPIDYLPYAERRAVEQLISEETPGELGALHPQVGGLVPLSENRSMLMRNLDRFELEEPNGTVPDTVLSGGVSMERYSDFGEVGDDQDGYVSRMYTALSYSILRDRNARMCTENAGERAHAQAVANERLRNLENSQKELLSKKRQRVDDINSARQAKQMQFQPVNGYLDQRWTDGIKNMVDIGIDRSTNPS